MLGHDDDCDKINYEGGICTCQHKDTDKDAPDDDPPYDEEYEGIPMDY